MDDEEIYKMAMKGYDYNKILDFVSWLISLDTPLGYSERRRLTLNKIIQKAKDTRIKDDDCI